MPSAIESLEASIALRKATELAELLNISVDTARTYTKQERRTRIVELIRKSVVEMVEHLRRAGYPEMFGGEYGCVLTIDVTTTTVVPAGFVRKERTVETSVEQRYAGWYIGQVSDEHFWLLPEIATLAQGDYYEDYAETITYDEMANEADLDWKFKELRKLYRLLRERIDTHLAELSPPATT